MSKLFFLGAGKMASAFAGGLVLAEVFQKAELAAFDVSPKAAAEFEQKTGVRCYWGGADSLLFRGKDGAEECGGALRKIVEAEFGVKSPTLFDRAGWHNTVIDWYAEFDLVTDAEFDAYYDESYQIGSYIMGNRLSKIIEWLDKYHAPAN